MGIKDEVQRERKALDEMRAEIRNRTQRASADAGTTADEYKLNALKRERVSVEAELKALRDADSTPATPPPPPRTPDTSDVDTTPDSGKNKGA